MNLYKADKKLRFRELAPPPHRGKNAAKDAGSPNLTSSVIAISVASPRS